MDIAVSQADVDRAISKVQEHLGPEKSSLIPGLQAIQEELGYLPREVMMAFSSYIRVRESEIWGAASFYAQFRFTPVGKHKITVCRGTACHVRGSANTLRELERELGIKAGETTEDLEFTLEEVACVGSCALAPLMVVDKKVYGSMDTKKARKLLVELKGGEEAEEPAKESRAEPDKKSEAKPGEKKEAKPAKKAKAAPAEKAKVKPAGKAKSKSKSKSRKVK